VLCPNRFLVKRAGAERCGAVSAFARPADELRRRDRDYVADALIPRAEVLEMYGLEQE